jgi:hypothetical protein
MRRPPIHIFGYPSGLILTDRRGRPLYIDEWITYRSEDGEAELNIEGILDAIQTAQQGGWDL